MGRFRLKPHRATCRFIPHKLDEAIAKQGMTLVPTQLYLKNRRIKIEVGVARGKKMYDKREAELKRTVERETRAQLKERNK